MLPFWCRNVKNVPLDNSVQRRFRSACGFAQSDQKFQWVHFGSPRMQTFFMLTTKTLVRLRGYTGWFESPFGSQDRKYIFARCGYFHHITKTCLFKYIENITTKNENFQIKSSDIFHIFAQNIDCGYSLEPLHRGGSNEYHNLCFWAELRKIMYTPVNPSFTI